MVRPDSQREAFRFMIIAVCISLVLLFVGAELIWLGRKGHKLDDHLVCRCGYDLYGSPRGATECPECGGSFHRIGAMRRGNRKSRPVLMTSGLVLTAIAALAVGMMGAAWYDGYDWIQVKPAGWLIKDATAHVSNSIYGDEPDAAELYRRLQQKTMTARQRNALAQACVELQSRGYCEWVGVWQEIPIELLKQGSFTETQLQEFIAAGYEYLAYEIQTSSPENVLVNAGVTNPRLPGMFIVRLEGRERIFTLDGGDLPSEKQVYPAKPGYPGRKSYPLTRVTASGIRKDPFTVIAEIRCVATVMRQGQLEEIEFMLTDEITIDGEPDW